MNLAVSADNSFSRWSLFGHRQAWRWAEEVIARVGVRPPVRVRPCAVFPAAISRKWRSANGCAATPTSDFRRADQRRRCESQNRSVQLIDGLAREGKGVIYASGEFPSWSGCATASACCGTDGSWRKSPALRPGKRHYFIIQPEERQREQGPGSERDGIGPSAIF
jgi:simple sugar transport system ATP-binding protein